MNMRRRVNRELTAVKNQIQRWLKIYFPEHKDVFGKFSCASSMAVLRKAPFPSDLLELKADGINAIWRQMKLRAVGKKRAARLYKAGFLAETGDLRRFSSPRQIQKLAGLAITENSSGKLKGQTGISRRGRSRLRTVLFQASIALAGKNEEWREIHRYYTPREKNPLKKKQSMSCKLIRVFYALVTKGCAYDPDKMLADIHRSSPLKAA